VAASVRVHLIGLLAAIVVLLITFGSLVAMGLPIVTALFGLGTGLGLIALFWNREQSHRSPLLSAVADVYRRYGLGDSNEGSPDQAPPAWPRDEMEKQPILTDVEVRTYESTHSYSTAAWLAYAASTSNMLILEPAQREAIFADVAKVIHDAGGVLEVHRRCDLYLARRTAVPV